MAFGSVAKSDGAVPQGPVGILVRIRVEPGRQEDFEAFIVAFAADVARFEHGCLLYVAQRAIGADCDYVIFQRFRSWNDLEAHGDTEHMRRALPQFDALLSAAPVLEVFTAVG